ncbi:MAG: trypsin-like peptidase domain-containing protein [Deltaproteobacteria bacterium]|nr:MAG: trypsin-like peptidase domain-containing protein [Deltaproteobacteria bacterium]
MKLFIRLVLIFTLSFVIVPPVWAKKGIRDAVVKIYTTYNRYNYYEPWKMRSQEQRTGSGCIISGKRILTNAHVVGDQTFIQVRRAGDSRKYTAEVKTVAHECDLAILQVNDQLFFTGIKPLGIGSLAEVRDKIAVYGFPSGGDELCITAGVVSRVGHRKYTHSSAYLLAGQIDAAINPGSSGGPVIKDDKIVGVAFQAGSGENISYMVPVPVINHFLKDIKDGRYDGIPGLGISWQRTESPDIRSKYNMTEKQTGVLVNKVYPDSTAKGILSSGDIILSIDGKNIGNDGKIEFRKGERTHFEYLLQNKYINDTAKFEILRENKNVNIEIKLSESVNQGRLVPHERYDVAPTYYILGGLVFAPLTLNFLKEWGNWYDDAPMNLVNYYYYGEATDDQREIVLLVKILADEANVGYHDWRYKVISYINGKTISTMKDLISAFEEHEGNYHTIVDEWGYQIVLDKVKVNENSHRILEKYKIGSDRSKDLAR